MPRPLRHPARLPAAGMRLGLALVAAVALAALTGCGGHHPSAVQIHIQVQSGFPNARNTKSFSLTCRPVGGTLPDASRICGDIRGHPMAMLDPAKPRWSCAQPPGGSTLTVTTWTRGETHTFAGAPGCDWPGGPTLEIYWAAIQHEPQALDRIEPTLRCEEDPTLLAKPTPRASAVACVHGLWTPRTERLIRLAGTVAPLSSPPAYKLFPHDIGAKPCKFRSGAYRVQPIRGVCGVNAKNVWSTLTITFVETWPAASTRTARHRWIVQVQDGRARLVGQSGPTPPQNRT
jgi:hypothetical protein